MRILLYLLKVISRLWLEKETVVKCMAVGKGIVGIIMENSRNELDIADIFSLVWKNKFFIAALSVVCAAIAFLWVYFSVPLYEADGILYVSNKEYTIQEDEKSINQSDLSSSRSLLTTYLEILKTEDFLKVVSEEIDGKYSPGQIARMLSLSPINETELLSIKVISPDAEDSYKIVMAILNKAPEKLTEIFDGGSVKTVNKPKIPKFPVDNGLVKKTVLGFLVGAVLGFGIVFLLHFFDKKIHKTSDLTERYQLSVLGEIRR